MTSLDAKAAQIAAAADCLLENGHDAVAGALRQFLVGGGLEGAMGLSGGWRAHLRRRGQDAALEALAAALGPFTSGRAMGDALEAALGRYRAAGYRHDRRLGRRPPGSNGFLHDVLLTGCPTNSDWLRRNIPPAAWGKMDSAIPHEAA